MHSTGVYSAGMGPKDPALKRFPDIKKKKKNLTVDYKISAAFLVM